MLVPYILFSFIGHLLKCLKMFVEGETNWVHYVLTPIKQILVSGSLAGNLPLWFLPSLLAVQLMYAELHKKLHDAWIIIISLFIAYCLYRFNIDKPLYLGNVTLGLAVYCFGHLMRNFQYHKYVFILAGMTYLANMLTMQGTIDFRSNMPHNCYYLVVVLFALSGCVVINNIFKRTSIRLCLLEYVGKHSMNFYVMHWLVLLACSIVYPYTGWVRLGAMITMCLVSLPVLNRIYLLLMMRSNANLKIKGEKHK